MTKIFKDKKGNYIEVREKDEKRLKYYTETEGYEEVKEIESPNVAPETFVKLKKGKVIPCTLKKAKILLGINAAQFTCDKNGKETKVDLSGVSTLKDPGHKNLNNKQLTKAVTELIAENKQLKERLEALEKAKAPKKKTTKKEEPNNEETKKGAEESNEKEEPQKEK